MSRKAVLAAGVAAIVAAGLFALNTSHLAPPPQREAAFIAHRGVHQTFHREGLTAQTCTATRIHPPTHGFLENTIPSIAAAFEAGAAMVEIDIHPTTDGEFAVFHDWTVDCRTNGTGVTRKLSMSLLKTLDIGYGYTADGGASYPFRGQGAGMMPTLAQVLAAFPAQPLLINFKSTYGPDADRLHAYLQALPDAGPDRLWFYGSAEPVARMAELGYGRPGTSRQQAKRCAIRYLALGWTGYVPTACRGALVPLPINVAPYAWGWPRRLEARLEAHGSRVILTGPVVSSGGIPGIDDRQTLAKVPQDFSGYIWTNRIEHLGPSAGGQTAAQP